MCCDTTKKKKLDLLAAEHFTYLLIISVHYTHSNLSQRKVSISSHILIMKFSSSVFGLSLLAQTACTSAQIVKSARTIKATIPSGDTVEIYRHGATVSSWTSSSKEQQLFLSSASVLDGSAALRGGIPVVSIFHQWIVVMT